MEVKKHRDGRFGDKVCYLWDIDYGRFEYVKSLDEKDNSVQIEDHEEKPKKKKKESKVVF